MSASLAEVFAGAFRDGRIRQGGVAVSDGDTRKLEALAKAAGLQSREPIGVSFENGPMCIAAYGAAAMFGAVAAPLPPSMSADQQKALWRGVGCRFAFTSEGLVDLSPDQPRVIFPDGVDWILFSSGSTGEPKAIAASLEQFRWNGQKTIEILGLRENALHLGSMSQCYTNGLFNSFMLPLLTDGSCELGPVVNGLAVRRFIQLVRDFSPQVLWVNPTVIQLLMSAADASLFANVGHIVSCTAPLPQSVAIEFEDKFKHKVLQSYGLSETLITTLERPDSDVRTQYSAGVPVGGTGDLSLAPDGRMVVHNGAVTKGYITVANGAVTLSLPDGKPGEEFIAQDLAEIADDGRVTIAGRLGQVLNVGGHKLGVERLEAALQSHRNVDAAVVVPLPDKRFGERIAALVEVSSAVDKSELAQICVDRYGSFARPAELFFVEAIPVTANGKIDRQKAAALVSQLSGQG